MLKSCITLAMSLCLLSQTLPVFAETSAEEVRQTQLHYWIETDLWGHAPKISELAAELSPVERYQIYLDTALKPEDLYAPTLLNVFPGLGMGSFIQGNSEAGSSILLGQIAGAILLGFGNSSKPDFLQSLLALTGGVTYLGFTIYGLVAPMQYRDKYNATLTNSLRLNEQPLQAQQPQDLSWSSATLLQF